MIKVNNKMLNEFLSIMEDNNEFLFGSNAEIKKQLELCLNRQGYWAGNTIRVYYDSELKEFYIESRW